MRHPNQGHKGGQMSLYVAASKVIYAKQTAFYSVFCEVITLCETPLTPRDSTEIR